MAQCPKCGTQATGKFCPNCGAQLSQADPTAAALMTPPPGAPQPNQAPQYQPPQGPAPGQYVPQPPQRKSSATKVVLIVFGVVGGLILLGIIAFVAFVAFVAKQVSDLAPVDLPVQPPIVSTPDKPVQPPVDSTAVTNLTITDQVDADSQAPVRKLTSVPAAADRIYAAIQMNLKTGQTATAK